MFSIDDLIGRCRAALGEGDTRGAVKEALARAVSDPAAAAGALDHERGELRRFGPVEALSKRLAEGRARGYALVDEEFEPGLVAVGAPVRDFRGRIVAAVNVSAPKFRFGARLEQAGEEVRRVADDLSRALGCAL